MLETQGQGTTARQISALLTEHLLMSLLCFLGLGVFISPTDITISTHGLVRRVEIPMSPWAYLGGDLGNSMLWRVGSEASKIDWWALSRLPL